MSEAPSAQVDSDRIAGYRPREALTAASRGGPPRRPVKLGVVCGRTIPETELFLAYWHTVLDAVAAAAVPVVELSPLETAPSQAVPTIYLDTAAQQEIASARLELPLLMLAGAFLIYASLVVLAYVRALRAFDE